MAVQRRELDLVVARAQSQPAGTAVVSERGAASRRDDRDPETLGRQLADLGTIPSRGVL